MKIINTVSIIGLGALGILYAEHFSTQLGKEHVRIVADAQRITTYQENGVFANGMRCDFHYVTPEQQVPTADLVLVATKFHGLEDALQAVEGHVDEQTIFLSVLNGITSEREIMKKYPKNHVVYCVAQGMDAVKESNELHYDNKGILVIGNEGSELQAHTQAVAAFFEKVQLPYLIEPNMMHRLWGKFMLNVGINQTLAMREGTYGDVQVEGEARDLMQAAMREVIAIANHEGITLTEADIDYWMDVIATLSPTGKPSMAQDVAAKRKSELPLFAGTVRTLGRTYGIPTPVNDHLFTVISEKELRYS